MLKHLALSALAGFLVQAAPPSTVPLPLLPSPPHPGHDFPFFNNETVFVPPKSWNSRRTSYGRTVLLNQNCEKDNVLLSTFTFQPPDQAPYFPIYESRNGGYSWKQISRAYPKHGNFNGSIILQPDMFELPERVGKYPAGTVLLSGNAIPHGFDNNASSTNIELWASVDKGHTWEHTSTVVSSGPPNTDNGAPCVWEPFIYIYKGEVIVYYSDQRDPKHGQKLAHQTSRDLVHWTPVADDVIYANYTLRPGMFTVAKLGNGKYIASHELAFAQEDPVNAPYAVHYQIADTPLDFVNAPKQLLKATDGTIPSACPYTVWTPTGGPDGTVVLSDGTYGELFLNTKNGDPKHWQKVQSGKGVAYSRSLEVMPDESVILVYNGGEYGKNDTIVTTGDYRVPGPKSNKDTISSCAKRPSPHPGA